MLPLTRPRLPDLSVISDKFARCLYQGNVTNNGEHCRRFERHLSEYLRAPTIVFNNGQTALITMLMAAGIGPGQEVIVPSFTFCGTVAAIKMLGAVPVFAEVSPERLTISPLDIEQRITIKTTAILGVDAYGICCDYQTLEYVAQQFKLSLLFDSAPAFGSLYGAFPTGRYGDAQIFSFHSSKAFSSMEGGAICSREEEFIRKCQMIRHFGQTVERECLHVGLNGKMLEVCALVGLENLKDWREYRHGRTFKTFTFGHRLHGVKGLRTTPTPDDQWPIWTYYPVFVTPEFGRPRDEVLAGLNEKGIMARKYYSPACHQMEPFANGQSLPVTERLAAEVIALPLYADMHDDEMNRVVDAFEALRPK